MPSTRAANANKHPGHIVKPPSKPRRTHAEVEAEKLQRKEMAEAAAEVKRSAIRVAGDMEATQRANETNDQAQAARPAQVAVPTTLGPAESTVSDDEWDAYLKPMRDRAQRRLGIIDGAYAGEETAQPLQRHISSDSLANSVASIMVGPRTHTGEGTTQQFQRDVSVDPMTGDPYPNSWDYNLMVCEH